jgi:hypothetical protein
MPFARVFRAWATGHFNFAATTKCCSYLKMRQSNQFRNATLSYSGLLILQDSIFADTQTRAAGRVELVGVAQPGRRRMAQAQE